MTAGFPMGVRRVANLRDNENSKTRSLQVELTQELEGLRMFPLGNKEMEGDSERIFDAARR